MAIVYNHQYLPISMYGHVIALLRECGRTSGAHVDVGCGYGAVAEPIRDELALTYVGFDLANDGLDFLRKRGFEAHQLDLSKPNSAELMIRSAIGEIPIASITLLDTLEHLTNGPAVLAMLRRLADASSAPLVLSVPNVAHKDLALKLLLGRWDVTDAGLLDHTHVAFYNYTHLTRIAQASGWGEIAAKDWLLERSDQLFPPTAPVLDPSRPLGGFLRELIDQANPYALVNQFVRAYRPVEPRAVPVFSDRTEVQAHGLSVILLLDGRHLDGLDRLLDGLSHQTSKCFQLIAVLRRFEENDASIRARISAAFPDPRSGGLTFLEGRDGARAAALNEAVVMHAAGRYVAVIDSAEAIAPDWASSLNELAADALGSVLCIESTGRSAGLLSPFLAHHLPTGAYAVPSAVFHDLGLRFDESAPIGAEARLITRAILSCGLTVSKSQTAVLAAGSALDASVCNSVLSDLNLHSILLPPGAAAEIELLRRDHERLGTELEKVRAEFEQVAPVHALIQAYPMLRSFVAQFLPAIEQVSRRDPTETDALFLSVIVRTQGTRACTLREALLSMAGQSSQNFELLLVVHSEDHDAHKVVEALVSEFPVTLRRQITLIQCQRPGRAAPLNEALTYARGRYIAVLDDDDFVFAHYVEEFEKLALRSPGKLVRTRCVKQDFELLSEGLQSRAKSSFQLQWPAGYDAVSHLHNNSTPFMSVAFPMAVFRVLGLGFDEELTTLEDWQLVTDVALLCGVEVSPEITAVYRWWTNGLSSTFAHKPEEWIANRDRIIRARDKSPILLPPGAVGSITELIDDRYKLLLDIDSCRKEADELSKVRATELDAWSQRVDELSKARATELDAWSQRVEALQHVVNIFTSTSWRLSASIRLLGRLLGKPGPDLNRIWSLSTDELQRLAQAMHRSTSWKLTTPIRKVRNLARGSQEGAPLRAGRCDRA